MRALLIALLAGLLLRAASLDYGLNWDDPSRAIFSHQQDEEGMVRAVLDGALAGDLDPGIFRLWGSAGYYLFAAADALVLWTWSLTSGQSWAELLAALRSNPSTLHLVHRSISVLASLALLWVVHRIARREAGPRVGALTALLLAAAYLPAREAHFGVLDTLCALWVVLAVDYSLRLAAEPRRRNYLLAGLWVGLAAATKYFGGVAALCVVAGHFAARRAAARHTAPAAGGGGSPPPFARLLQAGLVAAGIFLLTSPHVLYAPVELLEALAFQRDTIAVQPSLAGLAEIAGHHLGYTFAVGLGEILFLLALWGAVLAWRAGGRLRLLVICLLLLLPMFYVARSRAVRYGIAHVSLLALLGALAIERLAGARRRLLVVLTVAALLPSLFRTLSFNLALGARDTRQDVLDYLELAGAARDEVVAVGIYLPRPSLMGTGQPGEAAASWAFIDYLRATQPGAWLTREEGRTWRPRFLLRDDGVRALDEFGWADFASVVESEYRVVLRVDGRSDPEAAPLPDKVAGSPALLLPYTNPWVMSRPGPPMTLFERLAP